MDIRTVKSNVFISGYPMGEKLMDATGSTSSATTCARLDRTVSQSECCALITATTNSSELVSCRACPSGAALMGTARVGKQEDNIMPNGKCECCGATAVIYRKGGVNRCYHCHKTEAEPMDLPTPSAPAAKSQDGCQCSACKADGLHLSSCAVHNAPALPVGPCDCGRKVADAPPAPHPQMATQDVHMCLPVDENGRRVTPGSQQSWDDFEELAPVLRNHPREIFFAVQTGGKCALSGALADTIGAKAGSMVLVRKGENRLAIRLLTEPEKGALKLTPGKSGQGRLAFGGRTILAQVPLEKGRYAVDVVPWGCIVKTDEPMPVPGRA